MRIMNMLEREFQGGLSEMAAEPYAYLVTSGHSCEMSVIGLFRRKPDADRLSDTYSHPYCTPGNVIEMRMSDEEFVYLRDLIGMEEAPEGELDVVRSAGEFI